MQTKMYKYMVKQFMGVSTEINSKNFPNFMYIYEYLENTPI